MKPRTTFVVAVFSMLVPLWAHAPFAFETPTHERITGEAFERSPDTRQDWSVAASRGSTSGIAHFVATVISDSEGAEAMPPRL